MLWLLALVAAAAALGGRKKTLTPTATAEPSGHPRLQNVETFEVETYTILVGQDDEGTWDWRAWLTTVFEGDDELDGLEEGQGFDAETLEAAMDEARAWVAAELHGAAVGGGGPPSPLAITRRGVRLSGDCERISVSDIQAWIDYAGPVVESYDAETPLAEDVMRQTLGHLFPECRFAEGIEPSIRGQSWAATRERVQATIDKIVDGVLLSVEPVEDVVAARVVGMSVPATEGGVAMLHTGKNNKKVHAIVVKPGAGGNWSWWLWEGPRRKWSEATKSGSSTTRDIAVQRAKSFADA